MTIKIEPRAETSATLEAQFSSLVGAENIRTGPEAAAFATDVYRAREAPLVVVRPHSVEELQAAVRIAASAGAPILARGGGASYTDAYLPQTKGAVLIDMGGLNRIVEINEAGATVTVEAGVTWAALKQALDEKGLRTPFWGPFSGLVATIGGSVSQNSLSHGSGSYGISAQSVLSMDVVLANGEVLRTGSASMNAPPFCRHTGPDLTGLFTGDCGALGVKARITLPLLNQRAAFETASFAYASFAALHAGMRAASLEALDDSHFALDRALSQGQIARQESSGAMIAMALSVVRSSPNPVAAANQLARMAIAGRQGIESAAFTCHYIIEGASPGEAREKLHRLRTIMAPHAREIVNSVPSVVRGMPFAKLFNTLGPKGERWVPLHGVLPHEAALPFDEALAKYYAANEADMQRLGIWTGSMFETVQSSAFLYEIAIYWQDAQTAYHQTQVPAEYLKTLPTYPENLEARAFVEQLKQDLIALYDAHGAVHFQIGKAYPYASRLGVQELAAIRALKSAFDPHGLMNPGSLGL